MMLGQNGLRNFWAFKSRSILFKFVRFFIFLLASVGVALVSTIARVFQVRKNRVSEVIGSRQVAIGNVFQVRFKLFQVRGGGDWSIGGYAAEGGECARNGRKKRGIQRN